MAEDNTVRSYRSNDPHRRNTDPLGNQPGGSDPLAELARLIGQADPFADFGKTAPRRAEPREPQPAPPPSDWRKAAAAMRPFDPEPEQQPRYRDEPSYRDEPAYRDEPPYQDDAGYRDDSRYASSHEDFDRRDPYQHRVVPDVPRTAAPLDDDRYQHRYADEQPYGQGAYADDRDDGHYDDGHYNDGHYNVGHYDDGRYDAEPPRAHGASYYDDGAPMGPQDDELYDDPPRKRGRNGLLTAVTLIACAMVGTAGAYGYRTYYVGSSGTSRTPPVITAETTPNKVVASVDSQPTKSVQDRVREPGQGERVVPREEEPVELRSPPASTSPRVVWPAPAGPAQQQQMLQAGAPSLPPVTSNAPRSGNQPPATTSSVASTGAGGEPKRIRTVTIRPDGTDLSGRPVGLGSGEPPAPPRPAAKSGQRSNGPISLDPQGQADTPPPAPAQPAPAPAGQRLASAPSNGGTGGYLVQLSSQRSEADAQASFRSLQRKFPDQLASRSAIVRRADLGDKGTYYRAMVGPFGSGEEAVRFCNGLKAAGGQCLIQKN